jgi:hypothetical protein
MFFTWALLGIGLAQIINRAFYAMHDTRTPTIVSVGMVLISFALSLYLATGHWGGAALQYGSVALATTLTSTLSTVILIEILRRRIGGIDGRAIGLLGVKVLAASVVMGVVLYGVARGLAPTFSTPVYGQLTIMPVFPSHAPHIPYSIVDPSTLPDFKLPHLRIAIQVCVSMFAGILAFLAMLQLLRVKELELVAARLLGKFRRKEGSEFRVQGSG